MESSPMPFSASSSKAYPRDESLGTLYGISVGPGDPELISVKGLRLLQSATVVAFPAGIQGKPGMAQQIVDRWLKPQQVKLSLLFPYVQDETVLMSAWQESAQIVWQYLQQGQDVAFCCEGDVSFYSTFTYLAATLQELHPSVKVETVPGVCSPMAAASVLGLPLTTREQRLIVLPALYHMAELEAAIDWAEVIVLMKVSAVYPQVWQLLQKRGLLDRAHVVERATWPEMLVYRGLRDRADLKLPYFSLMIIKPFEN